MAHMVESSMVFFTKEELSDSPSLRDGMSAEEEGAMRKQAQQIIIDVCQAMHVHVQYAYVAVYLCLRYYTVRSWKRNDRWLIMPAALSLALKMRESPKPVIHIIAEFERRRWRDYERSRPGEPRRSHDKAYIDSLKEPFCLAERAILFVVGFEFGIGDPYPHVAKLLRALGLGDEGDRTAKIEVQQMAWNFLRDSLSTTLCLRYAPEKIAATTVFLAFQVYRRPLALSAESDQAEEGEAVEAPKTFCEVCNILPQELEAIANEITANYVAALRHPPGPQLSPQPAPGGRRPVALPDLESTLQGDRWVIAPTTRADMTAAAGGGLAPGVAAAAKGGGSRPAAEPNGMAAAGGGGERRAGGAAAAAAAAAAAVRQSDARYLVASAPAARGAEPELQRRGLGGRGAAAAPQPCDGAGPGACGGGGADGGQWSAPCSRGTVDWVGGGHGGPVAPSGGGGGRLPAHPGSAKRPLEHGGGAAGPSAKAARPGW